jgi:hypothetical protein
MWGGPTFYGPEDHYIGTLQGTIGTTCIGIFADVSYQASDTLRLEEAAFDYVRK